jgi:hypothetical protein
MAPSNVTSTRRSTVLAAAPTGEIGAPANLGLATWSSLGTTWIGDDLEQVPELMWPNSIRTYANMINDTQIKGLHDGATLPIRRYRWMIDPNDCDPQRVEELSADLNLPIKGKDGQPRYRTRDRFSHAKHMFHALKALLYGHYFMEQVAEIRDGKAHLVKLAPRPPITISEIGINDKGGLKYIKQNVSQGGFTQVDPIPVQKLVAYTWEQEGANWFGRSMLRSLYRNWLIKDRLLRVDAIKHERHGMGVPVAEGAPGMGKPDLDRLARMAQSLKAGETSGGSIPAGAKMNLLGVQGTIPDTIQSIRFHNEEMARGYLEMFMQLGETGHGNRALGEAFIDFFALTQDTIAGWYADVTTEHVIEDWWDWNVDPDADTTPFLTYERSDDPREAFGPFAQLVQTGAIQVDDEIENAIREAMELPTRTSPRAQLPLPGTEPAPTENNPADGGADPKDPNTKTSPPKAAGRQGRARPAVRASSPALPLPARPLRREPNDVELTAQVNFAELDQFWNTELDRLFNNYKGQVIPAQIEELQASIRNTSNLETLASLEAPSIGHELIQGSMDLMFQEGVRQAIAEAQAQGHAIDSPAPEDYSDSFPARARAVSEVNARTLGGMAGTRAMRLSGGGLSREEVANQTGAYLSGLAHSMLRDRLGGALSTAMNAGRRAVMKEGPAARYYSSELLDANTCASCAAVDGTEYASLSDSERDYPAGGFVECAGGDRCRGTVIAVYEESNA